MSWKYKEVVIESIDDLPDDVYGFVYLIVNKSQEERNRLLEIEEPYMYIGKKSIWSERTKKLGKKELEARVDKRYSKKKKVRRESDWLTYTGSNDTLNDRVELGDDVEKKILVLCYSKRGLTYQEERMLFLENVLGDWRYLNNNIAGRFFRNCIE